MGHDLDARHRAACSARLGRTTLAQRARRSGRHQRGVSNASMWMSEAPRGRGLRQERIDLGDGASSAVSNRSSMSGSPASAARCRTRPRCRPPPAARSLVVGHTLRDDCAAFGGDHDRRKRPGNTRITSWMPPSRGRTRRSTPPHRDRDGGAAGITVVQGERIGNETMGCGPGKLHLATSTGSVAGGAASSALGDPGGSPLDHEIRIPTT